MNTFKLAPTDVVQVELINSAYDLVIPIAAIVISLGTLVWTRIDRYKDRARLRVRGTSFSTQHPYTDQWTHNIAVVVTNVGRNGSTAVDAVSFRRGKKDGYILFAVEPLGSDELPKTLNPGESAQYIVDMKKLAQEIATGNHIASEIYPRAKSGHGEVIGSFDQAGLSFLAREVDDLRAKKNGA